VAHPLEFFLKIMKVLPRGKPGAVRRKYDGKEKGRGKPSRLLSERGRTGMKGGGQGGVKLPLSIREEFEVRVWSQKRHIQDILFLSHRGGGGGIGEGQKYSGNFNCVHVKSIGVIG